MSMTGFFFLYVYFYTYIVVNSRYALPTLSVKLDFTTYGWEVSLLLLVQLVRLLYIYEQFDLLLSRTFLKALIALLVSEWLVLRGYRASKDGSLSPWVLLNPNNKFHSPVYPSWKYILLYFPFDIPLTS